jgi:hypothetical protein
MPPRLIPFPLPYSIGTDICNIRRIAHILLKADGQKSHNFVNKILNKQEWDEGQIEKSFLQNLRNSQAVLKENQEDTENVPPGREASHNFPPKIWKISQWLAGR